MRLTAIAFLALVTIARAEPAPQVTKERAAALFAWYDQLPLPAVKDLKPVRVWLDARFKPTSGDFEPLTEIGFLAEDRGEDFRIISGDGVSETLTKHGKDPAEPHYVGYGEISLKERLELLLSKLGTPEESDAWGRMYAGNRAGLRRTCRLFMLARWVAERGDADLGFEALQALETWREAHKTDNQPESLETQLQQEMAASLFTRALHSLSERGSSRNAVLTVLHRLAELCPGAASKGEKSASEILERMAREEDAHRQLTEGQLAALPPGQRAEEWVFRLRDENIEGPLAASDDEQTARYPSRWPSNGAVKALGELGLAAGPALSKALDDDSFTRSKTPEGLQRVQDFALTELTTLSGCGFSSPQGSDSTGASPSVVDPRLSQREAARAWWQGVSKQGEMNYLIVAIRSNSPFSEEYGEQLLKKYPDDGIPVIIEAARSRPDWDARRAMLRMLITQTDQRCAAFFEDQLHHAPEVIDRLAAGIILRMRGDPRGTAAMRAEWPKLAASYAKTKWPDVTNGDPFDIPSEMITFLATAAAPEAVLSLATPDPNIPSEWRARIIEKLSSAERGAVDPELHQSANPATKVAIEDTLVEFLGDESRVERTHSSRTWFFDGNIPVVEPRVCDVAALALRSWKPEKYLFDHWRSPAARTRQCIACANARAKESGEPPRPLPPEPESNSSVVANSANVVAVKNDSAAPSGEISNFAAALARLRGAPLDGNALSSALAALATKPLPDQSGFTLAISRCSDETGISLRTNFNAGNAVDSSGNVIIYGAPQSANPPTLEIYGQESRPKWTEPAKWEPLRKALEKALAAPVNTGFLIVVEFTPDDSQK